MSLRSMWRPLGRPNCRHSARNFPSWSKIWMRSFERSATNSRPLESMARAWGTSNSPCPLPALPQALMNFPSFENFTMRALVFSPCPSATKMSPLGATKTSDGPLKVSDPSPATPGLPRVIKTFPSELNLTTVWPLPLPPLPSVTQTLPSRSANRPCGQLIMPPPKLVTNLPEASNFWIGGILEPSRSLRHSDRKPRRWCHPDRCRLRSPVPTHGLREALPNSPLRDRGWARHWDPRHGSAPRKWSSPRRQRRQASISHDHACHFLPLIGGRR